MTQGIRAYVGFNAGGKTLCMVEREALPALKAGRPVYANFRIGNPFVEGDWLPGAHPLVSPAQLLDLSDCTVLLDEITSIFPSRQAMSLPPDVQRLLNQFRKRDITIAWSAPNWLRSDRMLREVTQSVTVCRSFLDERWARDHDGHVVHYEPVLKELGRRDGEHKRGVALVPGSGMIEGKAGRRVRAPKAWAPRLLFRFTTFSAVDFEDFSINAAQKIKASRRQWYWRRRHAAHHSYSTLEEVMLFGHLDDVGICVRCSGTRPRKRCLCAPLDELAAPVLEGDSPQAPAPVFVES